jgi:hypothetical protein
MLNKLFHKIEREGNFSNLFYEATITLVPKLNKDTNKKQNYGNKTLDEHRYSNPQKKLQTKFNSIP